MAQSVRPDQARPVLHSALALFITRKQRDAVQRRVVGVALEFNAECETLVFGVSGVHEYDYVSVGDMGWRRCEESVVGTQLPGLTGDVWRMSALRSSAFRWRTIGN